MKSPFLLLAFCVFSISSSAQRDKFIRYNLLIDKARTLSAQSDYSNALQRFDSAFALIPWVSYDYLEAIDLALLLKRDEHANDLLIRGVDNGLDPGMYNDSLLKDFLHSDRSKPFLDQWWYWKQRYEQHIDTTLVHEISDIMIELHDKTSDEEMRAAWDRVFDKCVDLIERKGFPNQRDAATAVMPLAFLLQSMGGEYPDSPRWRKILPKINLAITEGTLDPSFLCAYQDQHDMASGKPVTYGALISSDGMDEGTKLPDRATLNDNRASVGLGPIEDLAVRFNLDPVTLKRR